jgi:hypothetical protein
MRVRWKVEMRRPGAGLGVALVLAGSAQAGIDFDAMPVGCSWTTSTSFGFVLVETFIGSAGDGYRTTVINKGQDVLWRHNIYDADGRLVRSDWKDGQWETYSPFSCVAEVGNCTVRYRNWLGDDVTATSSTVPHDNGFLFETVSPNGAAPTSGYFETGRFGLVTQLNAGFSDRLIEIDNCEIGS